VAQTAPVFTRATTRARTTGQEDLDGHAIAHTHAPPARRVSAHCLDDAYGFVARHKGEGGGKVTGVLLVVGAAKSTSFDAQDSVVVSDLGERKRADLY
jgi:hypothetical protein